MIISQSASIEEFILKQSVQGFVAVGNCAWATRSAPMRSRGGTSCVASSGLAECRRMSDLS